MIPNYVNRVRPCRTINQVNSVHLGLERLITPAELVYLWRVGVVKDRLCQAAAAANPNFALPEFKANVQEWLQRNIHHRGQCYTASELVQLVTGKPLTHAPLIRHLRAKLEPLYGLA